MIFSWRVGGKGLRLSAANGFHCRNLCMDFAGRLILTQVLERNLLMYESDGNKDFRAIN